MRHTVAVGLLACLGAGAHLGAQNVNWRTLDTGPASTISFNGGVEYGVVFGVAYGRRISSRLPVLIGADYSMPAGDALLDDFKVRSWGTERSPARCVLLGNRQGKRRLPSL